ncbi:MAG: ribosome biogenesis/translation initiation ATPase RLI [Candidatus Brockarchaeota archaeon]|nr:ribosome biogenesis/translation initiation ATPase RLI [Candidatus Brockarchaeota archaeon]
MVRIAVIDGDSCKPTKCGKPCRKYCPIVRTGQEAIYFVKDDEPPVINEYLCSGCCICVKKCPFNAVSVVNIPDELEEKVFHRYGVNAFKLYGFPALSPGSVTGILGENGIGKSTILKIIGGLIKPNLGRVGEEVSIDDILASLRGNVSFNLIEKVFKGRVKCIYKPQYLDEIPKRIGEKKVMEVLEKIDEKKVFDKVVEQLDLKRILENKVNTLSGGELQRLAIAAACMREGDIYLFDEPSSFLDVRQRLKAADLITSLKEENKVVAVVEHDLTILDYLADYVVVMYGQPSVYGVVSQVLPVRVGINSYLEGYIKQENIRFRKDGIRFHTHARTEEAPQIKMFEWPAVEVSLGSFHLNAEGGSIGVGEVIGIAGPNGIGKTTMLRELLKSFIGDPSIPDGEIIKKIGYKPQYVSGLFNGVVSDILKEAYGGEIPELFQNELLKPLKLDRLSDRLAETLSGGELQALAIAAALLRDSPVYFLDEPCAYLDVEQRLAVIRAIRHTVIARRASAFVVEHDIAALDFLSDRLILIEGEPSHFGRASPPMTVTEGMNRLLKYLDVTIRREPENLRPRINKKNSKTDRLQRAQDKYYY